MQTDYFRISKKEYCHITDDVIFIINTKEVKRIPLEHELGDGWGVMSILNYLLFTFLFVYTGISVSYYGAYFFKEPINYGALFLLFISLIRIKNGFLGSSTPTIQRNSIKSVYLKTPIFSFPRLVIYFEGPEGKVLRKIIPILYKKEALPVLQKTGLYTPLPVAEK
ncbi:MAG: hypothetical protein V4608_06590 [Bacteroidota bacterium]